MDEKDDRPWEKAGNVRRDCEPHRGPFLLFLGQLSLIGGSLAFCFFWPGLFAFFLANAVIQMARRDLRKMQAGLMDPEGEGATMQAKERAALGMMLAVLFLGIWIVIVLCLYVGSRRFGHHDY